MPIYSYVLFSLLAGYAILGRGFAYIGIGNVFIGEIVTAFLLLSFLISKRLQSCTFEFIRSQIGKVSLVLFVFFVIYLFMGIATYGGGALRDSVILWYIIFIYFGYWVGINNYLLNKYLTSLSYVFVACFIYAFSYPFGSIVRELSPLVNPAAEAYLLGHYTMIYVFVTGGIFYFLILRQKRFRSKILALIGISALLVLFSRAGYLVMMILAFIRVFSNSNMKDRLIIFRYLSLVVIIIIFLSLFNIYLITQNQYNLSIANIAQRVISIVSDHVINSELYEFANVSLSTKEDRLVWAAQSLAILSEDPMHLLFGKGLGFNAGAVLGFSPTMRYVHNSYITLVLLTGISGALLFFLLHALFIRKAIIFLRRKAYPTYEKNLVTFFLFYYFAFMMTGLFGPLLEAPFLAANLYFIMGVCCGLITKTKENISLSTRYINYGLSENI